MYEALQKSGAEVVPVETEEQGFLQQVLSCLAEREEVNEVLLECGATLAGSMLDAGLIDELIVYQSPHLLGSGARGMFQLPDISSMADRIELEITDTRRVGKDIRITLKPLATRY